MANTSTPRNATSTTLVSSVLSMEPDAFDGFIEKDRRRGDRRSQNAKFKKRDRRDFDDE